MTGGSTVRRLAWSGTIALTVALAMQGVRVAFPLLYDVREDSGAGVAVAWAIGAFVVAPFALIAVASRVGDGGIRTAVLALAAVRLAEQLVHPIPMWLGAVGVAVGLAALALVLMRGRAGEAGVGTAIAVFVGLAVEVAVVALFETWDPIWQEGPAAIATGVVLAAATVICATTMEPPERTMSTRVGAWPLMVVGPYLVLHVLFVHNVAFATSETGVPIAGGVALVLLGDALGVLVGVTVAARADASGTRVGVAAVTVAGIAALALVNGASVAVALPIASAALAGGFVLAMAPARDADDGTTARRPSLVEAAWFVAGTALFVGVAFAYQIDVDVPLPVPRATWPLAAAAVVAVAAFRRVRATPAPTSAAAVPIAAAVIVPLLLVAGSVDDAVPSSPSTYRLLDWNIHTAVDGEGEIALDEVLELIRSQDPDVVVLQEVGRGWPIAGQVDQLEWLSRRLDMPFAWAPAADEQFGNAVLSRYPIRLDRVLDLPYGEGPQERSALGVTIGTDPALPVVGVHLQHGDRPATRADQLDAVLDVWAGTETWVLAGDLNMQPGSAELARLEASGLTSVQDLIGDQTASTARDPRNHGDRVDWIWATTDMLDVADFAIPGSEASDHLALVVEITPHA